MKWQEQHEAFKKFAIQHGISCLAEFQAALPFGYEISPVRLDRWFKQMLAVPTEFCPQRRYINRFKLGADPEFVLQTRENVRCDARVLGLQQGLAFGMDNNGRLTEIRPYPSRSAMEVVASVLATLRWLAILKPDTTELNWVSGVYLHGDGIGGHVHFGRKRPTRNAEVKALDVVSEELLNCHVYNVLDIYRRRNGDQHNQHYGMPGDFRTQMHGYEYRTFPSWLDSPELAFLILTLSKLAVHSPNLLDGYAALPFNTRYHQRVKNLLSYFKDSDDDARLALAIVNRGFPVHTSGDFKPRWGIGKWPSRPEITFIPMCFEPTQEDIEEMFTFLSGKGPLVMRQPSTNWGPLVPPKGYHMAIENANTYGAKGLGEMLWDVVAPDLEKLAFVNERALDTRVYFSIPREFAAKLPSTWQQMTDHKIRLHNDGRFIYSMDKAREQRTFAEARRMLLETVFPLWKITDVKPDSYAQWKTNIRVDRKQKFSGTILYGDLANCPIKGLF